MKFLCLSIFVFFQFFVPAQSTWAVEVDRRQVFIGGLMAALLGAQRGLPESRALAKAQLVDGLSADELTHVTKHLYLYHKDIITEQGLEYSDDLFVGVSPRDLLKGAYPDLDFTPGDFARLESRLLQKYISTPQPEKVIEDQAEFESAEQVPCGSLLNSAARAKSLNQALTPRAEIKTDQEAQLLAPPSEPRLY